MSDKQKVQIGRLAMRGEGNNWVAYYTTPNTMDASVYLGSIRMNAIIENPERKQAFMDMMRDVVSDIIENKTGIRPIWGGVEPAPQHERAGKA